MLPGVGVFGTTATIQSFVPILKVCGFPVVALWGSENLDAQELATQLDIPFSTRKVDDVLLRKDVDLVVIGCPPHSQWFIAVKALGIGKHVLCSAPSGPMQLNAQHMVKAARYYPRLMSLMCYGLRFLPTIIKMKTMIEEGCLGSITICEVKVHYGGLPKEKYDWMCDEGMGGGVLNTIGSNIIDVITFLTKERALRVHGMLKTYTKQTQNIKGIREITSDDFCTFQMELDKGACVTVTLNSHIPGQFVQEIVICGQKGRLIARGSDLYEQRLNATRESLIHFDPIKEEERYGISPKARTEIPSPYLKGLIHMIEAVKDAFEKEEERQNWQAEPVASASNFEDALYVQTVVDAIRKSNKTKQWTKVDVSVEEPEPNSNNMLSDQMRRSTFSLQ